MAERITNKYELDLSQPLADIRKLQKSVEDFHEAIHRSGNTQKDLFLKSAQSSENFSKRLQESIRSTKGVEFASKALKDELKRAEKVYEDLVRAQAKFAAAGDYKGLLKQIEELKRKQKELAEGFKNSNKGVSDLESLGKKALGTLGGIFAIDKAIQFGREILSITSSFQKYQAQLTNTFGSQVKARQAMEDILVLAAKTPFSVDKLTESFTRLTRPDFTPTMQQMTQLGDLAASKAKDISQLVEALLDSEQFSFERLREFGVTAAQSGDKVKFSFNGVTTEVDKTSESVRNYILGLGKLQGVSGQMAAVSQTLEGQMSNLGDTIDQLLLTFGNASAGFASGVIQGLNDALSGITALLNKTQEEKNKVSIETIAQNQKEADSGQALLDRYKELTKDGIELNAEQKKELNSISLQLGDTFGKENLTLNENTGLWEVNTQAIEQAIKQRLLVANQEASSLALRAKSLQEQRVAIQKELDLADAALQDIENRAGLSATQIQKVFAEIEKGIAVTRQVNPMANANQFNARNMLVSSEAIAAQAQVSEAQVEFVRENFEKLQALQLEIRSGNEEQIKLSGEYVQILDGLKKLNFSEEDINRLFNPEPVKETTKAVADNSKEVEKLRQAYKELIKEVAFNRDEARLNLSAAIFGEEDADIIQLRARLAKERLIAEFEEAQKTIQEAGKKAGISNTEINFKLNILEQDYAAQFDTITVETEKKLKESADKLAKEAEKRRKDATAKQIQEVDQLAEVEENARVKNYGKELDALQTSLRNKKISLRQYHQERKALADSYDIDELQSQIKADEKKLQIASLSAEERFKIEKDLVEKRKALYDAEAAMQEVKTPEKPEFNIQSLLGLSDKEFEGLSLIYNQASQLAGEYYARQIAQSEALIAQKDREIESAEVNLDRQIELQKLGLASDIKGEEERIAILKKQREQALQDQRKAQRAQILLDSAAQASNLITAGSKIMSATAAIPPPLGQILGISAITAMIGLFLGAKAKAFAAVNSSAPSFRGGGGFDLSGKRLKGPSHESGGLHLVNPNTGEKLAEYEGNEFLFALNKKSTAEYLPILEAMNKGTFKQTFLSPPDLSKLPALIPNPSIIKDLNKLQEKAEKAEKQKFNSQIEKRMESMENLLKEISGSTKKTANKKNKQFLPDGSVVEWDDHYTRKYNPKKQ